MHNRLRPLALLVLCFAILLSGCSVLEKQTLPFQQGDDVATWLSGISTMTPEQQAKQADAVWRDIRTSQALRERALSIAASRPGAQGTAARTEMNARYASDNEAQRAAWESMYWGDLAAMDDASLRSLASRITFTQEKKFPWNLLMLKAARRSLAPDSAAVLERLSSPSLYASPAMLGLTGSAPAEGGPVYAALVLPQSDKGGSLGRQIAAGAIAAADILRSQGRSVDVRIIDSSQNGWQAALQSLPAQFTIVGGPLLPNQTSAVLQASAGRAVFTFTASLPDGAEGAKAWRFFSSPSDQTKALLDAADELGIRKFGIFSPGKGYSKRMAALFRAEAEKRGGTVTEGVYTADTLSAWPKEAGAFVQMEVGKERGSIPVAKADFDAIFLPDDWKNMDMLVSSLHYSGAQNKVMMGTAIWEQKLGPTSRSNAATFGLTIFPAAWNANASASAMFRSAINARGLKADDWAVLGFDFVQTAAALALLPDWDAATLNRRLSAGPKVGWAGAPMEWDDDGKASRKLFLLRPASVGSAPADLDAIKVRMQSSAAELAAPAVPQSPVSIDQLVDSITKN